MMTQSRLTDQMEIEDFTTNTPEGHAEAQREQHNTDSIPPSDRQATRFLDVDEPSLKQHPLWPILMESVRRNPMYPNLRAYVNQEILPKEPNISPRELAGLLSISLGEALVILNDR